MRHTLKSVSIRAAKDASVDAVVPEASGAGIKRALASVNAARVRRCSGNFLTHAVLTLVMVMLSRYSFAAAGADIYKAHCAPCHGSKGAGDTMIGRNLNLRSLGSDEVQKESDEELFVIIRKGRYRMPAFDRRLTKDQIGDLVKYIRSLKK